MTWLFRRRARNAADQVDERRAVHGRDLAGQPTSSLHKDMRALSVARGRQSPPHHTACGRSPRRPTVLREAHRLEQRPRRPGMAITDAILAGERDPARLAALADRRIKASRDTLIKALQGDWRPEHLFTLQQARQTYAHYQQLIGMCDQQVQTAIRALETAPETPPGTSSAGAASTGETTSEGEAPTSRSTSESEPFVLSRHLTRLFGTDLTLIPGIGESTALTLFAEIGADLSRFPDAAHFASWLNLCPQNKITGGKIISSKTGPASNRAAQALRMATQALYRSHSSLGDYFRRKRARLGTPQAITATAHKIARIIYHLVTHHVLYDDDVLFRQQHQDRKRRERNLLNQARALGFDLVPQVA